ncbi:MAG: hypothetical protein JNJ44_01605 [Zoogloeaceae bacterium]|nr:hypothetical protein [Zoogloeaceae bacterium]
MTPQSVETLMADIESSAPLDFADLSIGEEDARHLMATHFCELDQQLTAQGLEPGERLEVMAAIAAHTMVENMLLNVARLRACGHQADFRAWMHRHGLGE